MNQTHQRSIYVELCFPPLWFSEGKKLTSNRSRWKDKRQKLRFSVERKERKKLHTPRLKSQGNVVKLSHEKVGVSTLSAHDTTCFRIKMGHFTIVATGEVCGGHHCILWIHHA